MHKDKARISFWGEAWPDGVTADRRERIPILNELELILPPLPALSTITQLQSSQTELSPTSYLRSKVNPSKRKYPSHLTEEYLNADEGYASIIGFHLRRKVLSLQPIKYRYQ